MSFSDMQNYSMFMGYYTREFGNCSY